MIHEREPDSLAAREVLDAIIAASVQGAVSQDAVSWAGQKAYEQFRKEARAWAAADREREEERNAIAAKRERRGFWFRR